MKETDDLVLSLLDRDGSCRDVNFEHPAWSGVDDLIGVLRGSFKKVTVCDATGNTITEGSILGPIEFGPVGVVLEEGSDLFEHLQVFVYREEDGMPFVELTFFPDDLKTTSNLKRDFTNWANEMCRLLRADRYFVRYENASWQFGDLGPTSGVFLVSEHATRSTR